MANKTIRETLHSDYSPEGNWVLTSYIEWLQGSTTTRPKART